jgi:hypothetical protein
MVNIDNIDYHPKSFEANELEKIWLQLSGNYDYHCDNHTKTIYYDYYYLSFAFNGGRNICVINYFNNTIKICALNNADYILKLNYLTYVSPETIESQFKSWLLLLWIVFIVTRIVYY